jgi:hypothetical protein
MPAAEVKQLLGKDVWDTYYKFCNVRNPFDKVVSFFWMKLGDVERDHLSSAPFDDVRRRFLTFLSDPFQRLPLDRGVFMIDGKPIVDDFIRYEYILTDLKRICDKLRIEFSPEKLGKYKSDTRRRPEHFSEYYYVPQMEKIIRRVYAWEINHFNYQLS